MAEERIIDDDKDKKYRIRINEDGEEELEVIDLGMEEEQEEAYETGLEIPEFEEDDEEAAAMTPEELALARKREEEERAAKTAKAEELIAKARALEEGGDGEYALISLDSAEREYDGYGAIYPLKLRLLTKNFTDFSRLDEVESVSQKLRAHSSAADKKYVRENFLAAAEEELGSQIEKNAALKAENEGKKAERRARFKSAAKKSLAIFLSAFVIFIALLCVAVYFSTIMFADRGGANLVVTIVLFALAAVAFIASVILARPLARNARRVRLNERDSSTALGRSCIEGAEREKKLRSLCDNIDFAEGQEE